jgi:LssY C-terminus
MQKKIFHIPVINRPRMVISRKFWIFLLAALLLVMQGCSAFTPQPLEKVAFKDRAESSVNGGLTVTVAVPTIEEVKVIHGVKLASRQIQSVWLEVKNESADTYWFLPSGLDPEYFSPSEAAFGFHTSSDETNQRIDEHFHKLQFKNPILPGSTVSGFVLVNLDEGYKAIDIDLISRRAVKSFTFIIKDPDFKGDHKLVDFETLYDAEDIINIEEEEDFRRALEELPCCTTNSKENEYGDPLNLVLVGSKNDILAALIRRNWHATETMWSQAIWRTFKSFLQGERYRYSPISPLFVYGRRQDIAWQKARGTINKRNHMRFWLSPIRFRGKKVFVGQISRDIGVKFTLKSPTISTHVIDPDVDEARRYFIEDLAYSQALTSFGFVKGAGTVSKKAPKMNLVGDPFYTDGLRAVLFFESRPFTLPDIGILDWEVPQGLGTAW